MIGVFGQYPIHKGDSVKGDNPSHLVDGQMEDDILQAAIIAVTAFFRFLELALIIKISDVFIQVSRFYYVPLFFVGVVVK